LEFIQSLFGSISQSLEFVFIVGPVAQNSYGFLVGPLHGVPGGFLISKVELFRSFSSVNWPPRSFLELFELATFTLNSASTGIEGLSQVFQSFPQLSFSGQTKLANESITSSFEGIFQLFQSFLQLVLPQSRSAFSHDCKRWAVIEDVSEESGGAGESMALPSVERGREIRSH
jgi:hypothetical protein